jgi:ABC-2 type transport system ATP-binding protein
LTKHGKKQLEVKLENMNEGLLDEIKNLENMEFAIYIDETLIVGSSGLAETTEQVLRIIREKGFIVNKFNVRESDLEDVFLKLTGKKLRD